MDLNAYPTYLSARLSGTSMLEISVDGGTIGFMIEDGEHEDRYGYTRMSYSSFDVPVEDAAEFAAALQAWLEQLTK